ncbi:MAG: hypothetical protein IKP28_04715 [Clostridia bacterium]|nr:hypothetical protein [Clostridia bacterium]
MKRILVAFFALVLVFVACMSTALAGDYDAYLYGGDGYEYDRYGVCLCTQCTIRATPSTNGQSLGRLRNGQCVTIVGQYGTWYMVDLGKLGISAEQEYGFVKSGLIHPDPYWVMTTSYTYLYTTPWSSYTPEKERNGEQSNRALLVLGENGYYYAVQCAQSSPGTSFVRIGDIGDYSHGQMLWLIAERTELRDMPGGATTTTIDRFTVVEMIDAVDEYVRVRSVDGSKDGWVYTQFVQRIAN